MPITVNSWIYLPTKQIWTYPPLSLLSWSTRQIWNKDTHRAEGFILYYTLIPADSMSSLSSEVQSAPRTACDLDLVSWTREEYPGTVWVAVAFLSAYQKDLKENNK